MLRRGALPEGSDPPTPEMLQALRYYVSPAVIAAQGLDLMLGQHGLSLDMVTIVDLPNAAATIDPLVQGTVDVVAVTEPWVTRILATGAADIWWA